MRVECVERGREQNGITTKGGVSMTGLFLSTKRVKLESGPGICVMGADAVYDAEML